ncbi:MAG: hypothetical protein ABSG36_19555 [Acidimicrobiales bacterium]
MQLDHILASAGAAGYVSETLRGVKLLGDAVVGLIKVVGDTPHEPTQTPDGQSSVDSVERFDRLVIGDRNRTVQVQLAPDAQATIAEAGSEGTWPYGGSSPTRRVDLLLSTDSQVQVLLAGSHVGNLSDDDAQKFLPLLRAESNTDHSLTVAGWRYKSADDQWQLWLQLPAFFYRSFADPLTCIVCGKRVSDDYWQNPTIWISRCNETGGTSGRSVTAHVECMEAGEAIATAESIA